MGSTCIRCESSWSSGAVAHDVLGVLQLVAGQDADNVSVALDFPRADQLADPCNRGRRGGLAADAVFGEDAFGLENFFVSYGFDKSTRPIERAPGLLPICGVADANGRGFRLGLSTASSSGESRVASGRTGRARRLNDDEVGNFFDESHFFQLAQTFADCRGIPKVSARDHDIVGRPPGSLLKQFRDDRLLPLNAEGVHRIDKIEAKFRRDLTEQTKASSKLSTDFDDHGAEIERLSKLRSRNLLVGHEEQSLNARRALA